LRAKRLPPDWLGQTAATDHDRTRAAHDPSRRLQRHAARPTSSDRSPHLVGGPNQAGSGSERARRRSVTRVPRLTRSRRTSSTSRRSSHRPRPCAPNASGSPPGQPRRWWQRRAVIEDRGLNPVGLDPDGHLHRLTFSRSVQDRIRDRLVDGEGDLAGTSRRLARAARRRPARWAGEGEIVSCIAGTLQEGSAYPAKESAHPRPIPP
jgi:hypothetical protein